MKLKNSAKSISPKFALYIIAALIFAMLIEFFSIFDMTNALQALRGTGERIVYTLNDLQCENVTLNGNHVSCSEDPHFFIEGISSTVHDIEFKLSSLSSSSLSVQVYYQTANEGFSEETLKEFYYTENDSAVFLDLEQSATALRIDIGTDSLDSYNCEAIIINPSFGDYVKGTLRNLSSVRVLFYFLGLLVLILAVMDFEKFKAFAFRYRWALGFAFIILCTICKLHGSSIGQVSETALSSADSSNLWGVSRSLRSDEYVVFTEMALSQTKSGFKWFSDIWGYSATDMFMTYGQPVMNIVTIFRPFSAFYIILGAEYGLAFFWSARLVFLFLVSFEFARFLTKDRRILSLCYAILMALSPVVQWWFSINGFVEMLVFGQGAVLLLKLYIDETRTSRKILYMAGLVLCAGGYIMTLYPAWMVPLAYVFAACALALLIANRKKIKIHRTDVLIWFGGILVLAVAMLYIFKTSGSTIAATMNTVYPGKRTYTGGPLSNFKALFRGWSSWLWTFTNNGNACETTDFLCFFPIGTIISLIVIFKEKKRDIYLILMNIISLFLMIFVVFPMPEIIAKITLMSYSSARAISAFALVNLMILIRAISLTEVKKKWLIWMIPAALISTLISFSVPIWDNEKTVRLMPLIVIIVLVYLLAHYAQAEMRRNLLLTILAISLVGGGLVNPISSGLSSIYHNKIVQEIAALNKDDPGLWASGGSFMIANIPAITGADTLTALRTYPDKQLWEDLGLSDNEDIWNRYAHINLFISDSNHVELQGNDLINLYVTVDTLKSLGVKYLFSTEGLSQAEGATELYRSGIYSIWKLS